MNYAYGRGGSTRGNGDRTVSLLQRDAEQTGSQKQERTTRETSGEKIRMRNRWHFTGRQLQGCETEKRFEANLSGEGSTRGTETG